MGIYPEVKNYTIEFRDKEWVFLVDGERIKEILPEEERNILRGKAVEYLKSKDKFGAAIIVFGIDGAPLFEDRIR